MTKLLTVLTEEREQMYRFLGGLYIMEVDSRQLQVMKNMCFPELTDPKGEGDPDLAEGYKLLGDYIASVSEEDLEDLAADYAKVFLAAGDAAGKAAFPYESVYVDKKHQIGGSTRMQMRAIYLARGRQPDPDIYRTMEDNIGLMLEYMGILCGELLSALEDDDGTKASRLLREQKDFLNRHLANWAGAFTSDVVNYSDSDFYKGVAKITVGFLRKDQAFLKKAGAIWGID